MKSPKRHSPKRQAPVIQAPKRRGGIKPLASITEPLIAPNLRQHSQMMITLLSHWADIAGDLKEHCQPIELKQPVGVEPQHRREQLTVILEVRPAFSTVISMQQQELRQKINAVFGYEAVTKMVLRQSKQGR